MNAWIVRRIGGLTGSVSPEPSLISDSLARLS